MRGIIVGPLAAGTIWGSVHEEYVPCEKTYVNPEVIDLHEKKIRVQDGEEIYQTSAIYCDGNGLFYIDYLDRYEDKIEEPSAELSLTDQQIDPIETITPLQELPIHTDRLVTKMTPTPTPPAQKPLHKKVAWPYTNKRR